MMQGGIHPEMEAGETVEQWQEKVKRVEGVAEFQSNSTMGKVRVATETVVRRKYMHVEEAEEAGKGKSKEPTPVGANLQHILQLYVWRENTLHHMSYPSSSQVYT